MEHKVKNIHLVIEIKLMIIILIFFNKIKLSTQQQYVRSKVLQSGKILIINDNGIIIYNQYFEQPVQIATYSNLIQYTVDLGYIYISQFLNDENFLVFCHIKN